MTDATHWTDFDYIIVGVMVFSCVFAYFRGLVREILSLAAWIGAGIVTIYYFAPTAQNLQHHFRSPVVAAAIAGIGLYFLALIGFSMFNLLLLKSFKSGKEPGVLDNLLGLGFGFCRGALMISLAFFLLTVALPEKEYPDWLKQSVTRPYVAQGAAMLAKVAPDYLFEIASLERKAETEMGGKPARQSAPSDAELKPTAPPAPPAAPAPMVTYDADNPNNANNNGGTNSGYSRTTTQQLDRLIDNTSNQ